MFAQLAKVAIGIIIIAMIVTAVYYPVRILWGFFSLVSTPIFKRFGSPMTWAKKLYKKGKKSDEEDEEEDQPIANNYLIESDSATMKVKVVDISVSIKSKEGKGPSIKIPIMIRVIHSNKTKMALECISTTLEEIMETMFTLPITFCLQELYTSESLTEQSEIIDITKKLPLYEGYALFCEVLRTFLGIVVTQVIAKVGQKEVVVRTEINNITNKT